MRKILSIIVAIAIVTMTAPPPLLTLNAFAEEIPTVVLSGAGTLEQLDVREALAPYGGWQVARVEIVIEGYTGIGWSAFADCHSLTSIIMPSSVELIGFSAFADCHSLTSIIIPNSVTRISGSAFANCYSLTSIIIPNSVTQLENRVFRECHALTSVTIQGSIKSIDEGLFDGCIALTQITIPNGVTTIGWRAFRGCNALTSIIIPNSVVTIGGDTFSGWTSSQTINVQHRSASELNWTTPPTAPNIIWGYKYPADESYVITFDGTGTLTKAIVDFTLEPYVDADIKVVIKGYDLIGAAAFEKRNHLKEVTIINGVKDIGLDAFSSCGELEIVNVPSSVRTIGESSFSNCNMLNSIIIPKSVVAIDGNAFYGWTSEQTINMAHEDATKLLWRDKPTTPNIVWNYGAISSTSHETELNLNLRKTILDISQPTFLSIAINPNTSGLEVISSDYYIQSNNKCPINVELTSLKLSDSDNSGYSIVPPDSKTWESLPMQQKVFAIGIEHANPSELSNGVSLSASTLWSTDITEPIELCSIAANKRATFKLIAQHGYSVNEPRTINLEIVPRIYVA